MIRKAFKMSVKKGYEEEYQKRHDEIWQELKDIFTTHKVSNYSIFLDPATNDLFAYVEIDNIKQWDAIAETTACKRWWAYMKDIMPTNGDNSPISTELTQVFHFN